MVEKTVGLPLRTPGDFEMLIGDIHQRTGSLLSLSTVKRFWGYVDKGREGYRARQTTLDILSQFVGFHDWAAFCLATVEGDDDSGPMVNRHLFVKEQQRTGDVQRDLRRKGIARSRRLAEEGTFRILHLGVS